MGRHYHFALAGDGSRRQELEQMATELGIARQVYFLGAVADMPSFYRSLNVFCLPSHAEGLPLSPLEAQASGVPVMLTDVGGTAEATCPHTGRLVTSRDADALAEALKLTADNRVAQDPRAFVQTQADQTLTTALYDSLLRPEGDASC
jgi:glycosyltransferase involved in cell wall biosynthesis